MTRLFAQLDAAPDAPLADVDRDPTVCAECGEPLTDWYGREFVPASDLLCGDCRRHLNDRYEDESW